MPKPRDYSLTFAIAGEREIKATGRYLYVLSTPSSDVFISIDGGSELQRGAGQAIFDAGGFSRVTVRSPVAQTVLLSISDDQQFDSRSNVALTVSANVTPGDDLDNGGDVSCAAGVATQVLAADPTRLAAIIKNPDTNTATMRVGKAGVTATSGFPLEPGASVTLAYTGAIYVFNPGGSAETVSAIAVLDV